MKYRLKRIVPLALISAFLVVPPVFAQVGSVMTDEHIARIRTNCQAALITLGQIHANDAPAYINRNQTYFSISDKLIARLNGRLTLNRYDATQLVGTASDYNAELVKFRAAYKTYDDAMSDTLRTNCKKDPVSFYNHVAAARDARLDVKDSVDQLTTLLVQYQQQVQQFKDKHFSDQTGGKA